VNAYAQRSIAYITARQTGRGSRRADQITMEVIQSADNDRFGQKLRRHCKKVGGQIVRKNADKNRQSDHP